MPFDATVASSLPVAPLEVAPLEVAPSEVAPLEVAPSATSSSHAVASSLDAATLREVHATLLRRAHQLVPRSDAPDLVQDTWLAALDGLDRFEGRASMLTWLTSILRHKAADRYRSARHRRERLSAFETEPPTEARVIEILGARDALDRVTRSLAAMEPRARTLVLAEIDGEDDRERLAREHGVTRETYRVQLCRARAQLRADLAA
jgi:RNA polymerase sigma-70 factor (ECF subfamily)